MIVDYFEIANMVVKRLSEIITVVFVTIIGMTSFSCSNSNERRQYKQAIEKIQSQAIQLPLKGLIICKGQKSYDSHFNEDAKLKLIVFSDSLECTSCAISHMYLWNPLIDYAKQFNGRLCYYFIFAPMKQEIHAVESMITNIMFDYPILLDTIGEFKMLNPHLPQNTLLHSFLLNEKNEVILVGNPSQNKKIQEVKICKTFPK